ncbi:MAG: biosynthetic-type acetolactate synthase large subunit [Eubacteriales bacterium]|jgi:acetolactate synthase-1/2/3 large subunit
MGITGNSLWVKALKAEGVDTIFAYPGGYVLGELDELYKEEEIELVLPRHEQGLIHAAEGYARSTGKVGVCLVTSGPGATNLITGIADANYDSTPLVCFTGQVPMNLIGNDAFQEVDIVGITRSITKYSVMVTKREDLGRIIKEAFYIARTGRPGPVVVDLPADVMAEKGDNSYPSEVFLRSYRPNTSVHVGQLKKAMNLLHNAKRPLFLAGGGINIAHENKRFRELVELTGVPVITTVMGKGAIPTNHPLYVGNVGMHGSWASNQAISECDVLFSIGTRFNDRITGKISEFATRAKIIHLDIDTASISRNIHVDIPIVAPVDVALDKMLEMAKSQDTEKWLHKIATWKETCPLDMREYRGFSPKQVVEQIHDTFDNSIVVTDVGQHQMWTTQFYELDENRKLITSGGLGTMGFGLPAAIGAQIGNRDKRVIAICGDGGVQMCIQELATATIQELPLVLVIMNNSFLGMVRQMQQLYWGRHYSATCMRLRRSGQCGRKCHDPHKECPPYVPDFVKLAESYECLGFRATNSEELQKALDVAKQQTCRPTVIECIIEMEDLVLPAIKSGDALQDMIVEVSKK